MATPISGLLGTVTLSGAVAHVLEWSVNETVAVDKFSSSDTAGYTDSIPGTKSWTGSFRVKYDGAAAVLPGTEVTNAIFAIDNTNTNRYVGNIVITGADIGVMVDQGAPVPVYNYSFDGKQAPSVRPT